MMSRSLILLALVAQLGCGTQQTAIVPGDSDDSLRRETDEFFQEIDDDPMYDVSKPLDWQFTLKNAAPKQLEPVTTYLRDNGFKTVNPIEDEHSDGRFQITCYETRIHTAESLYTRAQLLTEYAESQGLDLAGYGVTIDVE